MTRLSASAWLSHFADLRQIAWGWNGVCRSAAAMQLGSLGVLVITASLACACATQPRTAHHAPPAPSASSEYKLITPDVSTYPPRVPPRAAQPPDENEDVMASILAIPPGR